MSEGGGRDAHASVGEWRVELEALEDGTPCAVLLRPNGTIFGDAGYGDAEIAELRAIAAAMNARAWRPIETELLAEALWMVSQYGPEYDAPWQLGARHRYWMAMSDDSHDDVDDEGSLCRRLGKDYWRELARVAVSAMSDGSEFPFLSILRSLPPPPEDTP